MKNVKRIISILLAISMLVCSNLTVFATSNYFLEGYGNVRLPNSEELDGGNINSELKKIFPHGKIVAVKETPYGTAYYVDRNYYSAFKTKVVWDALDVVMAGASWAKFFGEPSLANLGWATLDTVALLPALPSSAYIREGGKILLKVDEVKKLAKTPEGLKKVKRALKITDQFAGARKLAKNYILSENTYKNHILSSHSYLSTKPDKSKFIKDFDIKRAIRETLTDSKSDVSDNTYGRVGYIFIKDYGRKIGTEGNKSLNKMKVVIDTAGRVITAYPIS